MARAPAVLLSSLQAHAIASGAGEEAGAKLSAKGVELRKVLSAVVVSGRGAELKKEPSV